MIKVIYFFSTGDYIELEFDGEHGLLIHQQLAEECNYWEVK